MKTEEQEWRNCVVEDFKMLRKKADDAIGMASLAGLLACMAILVAVLK